MELPLHSFFLTASLLTTLLGLLKSTRTNFNFSISNSSTFNFRLAKSAFSAKSNVSTLVAFLKVSFVP